MWPTSMPKVRCYTQNFRIMQNITTARNRLSMNAGSAHRHVMVYLPLEIARRVK